MQIENLNLKLKVPFIVALCFVASVFASHDVKESTKTKRAYRLGYHPYAYNHFYDHAYDHDTIAHAPIVYHHPPAVTTLHHAPIVSAIHAPLIAPSVAKTSVVTTNIHSVSAPLVAAHHSPIISSSYFNADHPVAAISPFYTEFHRRR